MLQVGVFGVGHLGKFHLNNWNTAGRIVGFYDPHEPTAIEVAEKNAAFGVSLIRGLGCMRGH